MFNYIDIFTIRNQWVNRFVQRRCSILPAVLNLICGEKFDFCRGLLCSRSFISRENFFFSVGRVVFCK